MQRPTFTVLAAGLAAVLAAESLAQVQVTPLPRGISPRRISGDGNVVVGYGGGKAVVWDRTTGVLESLPAVAGVTASTGSDVSADGSVVVGSCTTPSGQTGFMWRRGVGVQLMNGLAGQPRIFAGNTVSGDGLTAGGNAPSSDNRAAIWTPADGTTTLAIAPEVGSTSFIAELSYDGSVGVGNLTNTLAFLWRQGEGCRLIPAPDGLARAYRLSLTSLGDAVYGMAGSADPGYDVPFLWTPDNGTTVIPDLPDYDLSLRATNDDGRLVVGGGSAGNGTPNVAIIHTFGVGTTTLAEYLSLFGASYQATDFHEAIGISDDGRVILGQGGLSSYWVVEIPPLGLADFNLDTMTDFHDLSDYLDCFEGLGPLPVSSADLNRDGITDFFDLIEFYDRFGG